jgi:hypothetical protein
MTEPAHDTVPDGKIEPNTADLADASDRTVDPTLESAPLEDADTDLA